MKTVVSPPKPGCCGPVADRAKVLVGVTAATVQAHTMLSQLYRSLKTDFPEEADEFEAAAVLQERLAEESKNAVIPDSIKPGEVKAEGYEVKNENPTP